MRSTYCLAIALLAHGAPHLPALDNGDAPSPDPSPDPPGTPADGCFGAVTNFYSEELARQCNSDEYVVGCQCSSAWQGCGGEWKRNEVNGHTCQVYGSNTWADAMCAKVTQPSTQTWDQAAAVEVVSSTGGDWHTVTCPNGKFIIGGPHM